MKNYTYLLFMSISLILSSATNVWGQIPVIVIPPESLPPESAQKLEPIELADYSVSVRVTGFVCRTSATMTFYNPNSRSLQGDLQFPLPEGVTISGYALDVNGRLTDAVAVGKEKARVALETEIRRGVDPGIVEATAGNQFKTRIFPLPSKGTRTIRVDYVSTAEFDAARGGFAYRLSLAFPQPVKRFAIRMEIVKPEKTPKLVTGDLEGLGFQNWSEGLFAETVKENFKPVKDVILEIPVVDDRPVRVEKASDSNYYFAAAIPVDSIKSVENVKNDSAVSESAADLAGKSATIFWDCSSSRDAQANRAKEQAILKSWLSSADLKSVRLIPVRNNIIESEIREVVLNGDDSVQKFVSGLSKLQYDGATNLGAIVPFARPDEVTLLFTDGFANWGETNNPIKVPGRLFVFSSGAAFDATAMTRMARDNNGAYFNLNLPGQAEAFQKAVVSANSFLAIEGKIKGVATNTDRSNDSENGDGDLEVYPKTLDLLSGSPVRYVCGRLSSAAAKKGNAEAVLSIGSEDATVDVSIQAATEGNSLRALFAQTKLAELNLSPKTNADAIESLGKQYGLATRQTSLIVLESLEQYVRHEICPPESMPDLRKAYLAEIDNRKKTNDSNLKAREKDRIEYVGNLWKARISWWEKKFNESDDLKLDENGSPIQPRSATAGESAQTGRGLRERTDQANEQSVERLRDASQATPVADMVLPAEASAAMAPAPAAAAPSPAPAIVAEDSLAAMEEDAEIVAEFADEDVNGHSRNDNQDVANFASEKKEVNRESGKRKASLEIKTWQPDADYIKTIQKEKDIDRAYEVYLTLKKDFQKSPSFYLECADEFNARQSNELSVRILSNLAEMDLENPQVLRVLGYRLLQWELPDLAVPIFETVLSMRPEEPQSYRDLAVALGQRVELNAGQDGGEAERKADLKRALELYDTVICGRDYNPWDSRFPGIEAIALNEANQLIPLAREAGIESIPIRSEWVKLMDVDVRISMTWSADNTDIDLWVTEPSGEKTYYGHNLSQIGGMITSDFTGGYGPEVYLVRRAMPGEYKIEAHYYGSRSVEILGAVTVQVDVYTNFGRDNQKRESLTFPLKQEGKDTYEIGRIRFDK